MNAQTNTSVALAGEPSHPAHRVAIFHKDNYHDRARSPRSGRRNPRAQRGR